MQTKPKPVLLTQLNKQFFFFLLIVTGLLLGSQPAQSQDKPATVYVAVNYLKTSQGRYGDYMDLLKTYVTKINEAHLKAGRIIGWYTHDVVMPTGSSAEYNFTVVTVSNDLNLLLNDTIPFKKRMQEAFPDLSENAMDNILESFGAVRTLVKREIYTYTDGLNMDGPPAKFIQVDFMKPTAGKTAEYVKLEKDTYKPIHAEMVKKGNKLDWGLYEKQWPYSSGDEYDYITGNFFSSINQMMSGNYEEAFKKLFPKMDMATVGNQTNSLRKIVRSELWRLGIYVDATNAKK
jgi:hypothetical protein